MDTDEVLCVGGPKDGLRMIMAFGAKEAIFYERSPTADRSFVTGDLPQVQVEVRRVVYRRTTWRAGSFYTSIFVPVGQPEGDTLRMLIANYRKP